MILSHLAAPGSKEAFNRQKEGIKAKRARACQKVQSQHWNQSNKLDNTVLDYNPEYKINTHDSMWIYRTMQICNEGKVSCDPSKSPLLRKWALSWPFLL